MAFLNPQVTKRIELPDNPGEWVEIKTVLTQGIRQRALSAGMKLSLNSEEQHLDPWAYRRQLLADVVVAWSDPTPLSAEALDELPPSIADWLAEQFESLNAGRSEDEKNPSGASSTSGPAQTPSSVEASGPASSPT